MRQAFRQQGFARLYGGLASSMLGDSMMLLVLSIWVKTLTGSNAMAGLTFLFMVLPSLVAPLLGVLIDRVRRRPMLVWGNLASALVVLPLVLVRDAGDVWIIWLVAFGYGVSFVVLPAALNGLLKELMPDELLVEANSAVQTTKEAYRLFGPLLGAALFAWLGGWSVAFIDALTFVVAALAISSLPLDEEVPERTDEPVLQQITAGVRHLVGDRVLGHTLIGVGLSLLVIGFVESSIYALLDAFDRPPTYAGVFVAAMGVGAIGCGLVASRAVRRAGEVTAIVVGLVVFAIAVGGIAAAPSMDVVLVFAAVSGAGLPLMIIGYLTLLQRRTPQAIMGRASTAAEVVMATPQAVSLALGSLLVVIWDYRVIFAVVAVVMALGALHIVYWLREHIAAEWRQGAGASRALAEPDPAERVAPAGAAPPD
ncbi:MFS transporter [Nocardioides silvaticus]|uniref:MFS transporter n=1 Tax=Nocardioides silvaticus TaxID=2201891 RepID=A0A316TMH7_9ACTN|nr:MFS transporter [Nocardioides silvaticus]PWN00946.1 MFS transporter [Nocardioides silvaticus]